MRYLLLTLAFILGMIPPAFAQDRCSDILRNGSFDIAAGESDSQAVSAFLNWYKSFDSGQSSDQKHADLTVISDPSVVLNLGSDQEQSFIHSLDKLSSGFSQYDTHTVSYVKAASKVIADAWSRCMAEPGISAGLKFSESPADIFLNIVFKTNNGQGTAIVRFSPPPYLICDGPRRIPVTIAGKTVRCRRRTGQAGAITLNSETEINSGNNVLQFASTYLHTPKTGRPYATCRVIDSLMTGNFSLGPAQAGPSDYHEIGGGTPTWTLHITASEGLVLTNIQLLCTKLDGDNPCAFVRGFSPANLVWTVPEQQVQISPTTDSDRVGLRIASSIQRKTPITQDQLRPETMALKYGVPFEIAIPSNAADVSLSCGANGDANIVSIKSLTASGGQIYLVSSHQDESGKRIVQASVLPFDINQ